MIYERDWSCTCFPSLGRSTATIAIHGADEGQPAWNSCPPFAQFALHTLFHVSHTVFQIFWQEGGGGEGGGQSRVKVWECEGKGVCVCGNVPSGALRSKGGT